jgi:hypothetical protein
MATKRVKTLVTLLFGLGFLGSGLHVQAGERVPMTHGGAIPGVVLVQTTVTAKHQPVRTITVTKQEFTLTCDHRDYNGFPHVREWITDTADGEGTLQGYYATYRPGGAGDNWGRLEGTIRKDASGNTVLRGRWWHLGGTGKFQNVRSEGTFDSSGWEGWFEVIQ